MSMFLVEPGGKKNNLWILNSAQFHKAVLIGGSKELIVVIPSEGVLFFVINIMFNKNAIAEAQLISVSQNVSEIHHS